MVSWFGWLQVAEQEGVKKVPHCLGLVKVDAVPGIFDHAEVSLLSKGKRAAVELDLVLDSLLERVFSVDEQGRSVEATVAGVAKQRMLVVV